MSKHLKGTVGILFLTSSGGVMWGGDVFKGGLRLAEYGTGMVFLVSVVSVALMVAGAVLLKQSGESGRAVDSENVLELGASYKVLAQYQFCHGKGHTDVGVETVMGIRYDTLAIVKRVDALHYFSAKPVFICLLRNGSPLPERFTVHVKTIPAVPEQPARKVRELISC